MVDLIIDAIGTILYPMFSIIFLLIFLVQDIFYGMAGIGDIRYGGYGPQGWGGEIISNEEGGLVYYLLQSSIVKNLLISIGVLALILTIIFTILAIIKNMYSSKPKNWQEIIGDAIKGLAMFIIVPVCCLGGVFVGNIVLRAVNSATNVSAHDGVGSMLFISSAYNANKLRIKDTITKEDLESCQRQFPEIQEFFEEKTDAYGNLDKEYYADLLDRVAAEDIVFKISAERVGTCYNLGQFNYLLLIAGGIFILYIMLSISFGMIKRLFMILVLFVISPVICSLYPIRGNSPVKSLTDDMVKQTISAYGAVAGMNIMFALLPLVQNITFPVASYVDVLGIIPLLMTIAGLFIVKDVITLISNYIGADNAMASGAGLMGSVKGSVKNYVGKGSKMVGGAVSAFSKARTAGSAVGESGAYADEKEKKKAMRGAFFGSLGSSTLDSMQDWGKETFGLDIKGATIDSWKAGEKAYLEKDKKYAAYRQAKDDYKAADSELGGLTNPDNVYLKNMQTKFGRVGFNTDTVIKMANNGQRHSQEDINRSSGLTRARYEAENAYIDRVLSAQAKKDDADHIIKSYSGMSGLSHETLEVVKELASKKRTRPTRPKREHTPDTTVIPMPGGTAYFIDPKNPSRDSNEVYAKDWVPYINAPAQSNLPVPYGQDATPPVPYTPAAGGPVTQHIANANIQSTGNTQVATASGFDMNGNGRTEVSDFTAQSTLLPFDAMTAAFEQAISKLANKTEEAIKEATKDLVSEYKRQGIALEEIQEALKRANEQSASGGASGNSRGKKGKK